MRVLDKLMTFFRALRRSEKPADIDELDQRLDAVEEQLERNRRARLERLDAQIPYTPPAKGR